MQLPDLKELGFPLVQDGSGGKRFRFYYRLALTCNGANVKIRCDIASPLTDVYIEEDGGYYASSDEIVHSEEFTVVDASCSPFVRGGH